MADFVACRKDRWSWTMMIVVPDFIERSMAEQAVCAGHREEAAAGAVDVPDQQKGPKSLHPSKEAHVWILGGERTSLAVTGQRIPKNPDAGFFGRVLTGRPKTVFFVQRMPTADDGASGHRT